MHPELRINSQSSEPYIDIALDTIAADKQALIFVSTKPSAEKTAEDIAKKIKEPAQKELADKILNSLAKPTKQCIRLAKCVEKGIAFHHAGLHSKQKELIEDAFRAGSIKIIACTPTLCISKDTMIWQGVSEKKVSEFEKKERLFGVKGNALIEIKAKDMQKSFNISNLISIASVSGYSIKVTPEHKMLIKRDNHKTVLTAKNLLKTDKIATIGNLKIKKIRTPSIKEFIKDNLFVKKEDKFTPQLSYFIGAMLGDGYSGAESDGKKIIYKGSPSIVGIDKEVFDSAENICLGLGIYSVIKKNFHGTPCIILGKNRWFREFLARCGIETREDKHISEKLMNMDVENTAALLKGLFDTDGCVENKGNISFSNISIQLIKQMQKLLLRFGICTRIRVRPVGTMKIYEKTYKTKPSYELSICQKRNILKYYKYIGFNIHRKQEALVNIVSKICSNFNYISCEKCNYKVYRDLFSGRCPSQKKWGDMKLKTILMLGKNNELCSRKLNEALGHPSRKAEARLNHHYELITKRRTGSQKKTEWHWSLNPIGRWIYENILRNKKTILEFFKLSYCPICNSKLELEIKKGWRDSDFEGDIFWDKIRELKEVECENEVYDVILPDFPPNDHLFVANGFIVHNSAGLDMPAFRTVLREVKRHTQTGYNWIPVLEYHQMAGRAGRPGKEEYGECIIIANNELQRDELIDRYINGLPEEIFSKLAVEPVLRTYILSLISTGFVRTKQDIITFFSKTFWAHQFKEMDALTAIIEKMLHLLSEFEFIQSAAHTADFVSANEKIDEAYEPTLLGKRVAELYVDPLTADHIIACLRRRDHYADIALLQMVSHTLEMRPLVGVKLKEFEAYQEEVMRFDKDWLEPEPAVYDDYYDGYLDSVKTALFFYDWINEVDEDFILEKYNVRPGEVHVKLELADWLLYASAELAGLSNVKDAVKDINRLRFRLAHGIKEELIPLCRLKGISRIRARKLFSNGIKDLGGVKTADVQKLGQLLGPKFAYGIKAQVGQELDPEKVEISEHKRKGQMSLGKY